MKQLAASQQEIGRLRVEALEIYHLYSREQECAKEKVAISLRFKERDDEILRLEDK